METYKFNVFYQIIVEITLPIKMTNKLIILIAYEALELIVIIFLMLILAKINRKTCNVQIG